MIIVTPRCDGRGFLATAVEGLAGQRYDVGRAGSTAQSLGLGGPVHDDDQLHRARGLAARYRLAEPLADRLAGIDALTDAVISA